MNIDPARLRALFIVLAPLVALVTFAVQGSAAPQPHPAHQPHPAPNPPPHKPHKKVCAEPAPKHVSCDAEVVTQADGVTPAGSSVPPSNSYTPADLQSAYNLPSDSAGSGQTVAVVDAFDDPKAEADLAVYRSQYGLPPCTSAEPNPCFRKVDQNGGTSFSTRTSWHDEISLDLDMVSAACPNCSILLVEASSDNLDDIVIAEDTAARLGAVAISNSYGTTEFSDETFYEPHYRHPGVAVTVSSGDNGYGTRYPASSAYVTAVGGTTLTAGTTATWAETAWSGSGSGCSKYIAKPSWQTDTGCARRTVADVSAVANPSTGVAVYDSVGSSGTSNWFEFGGTSAAAPIIAATYALGGNTSSLTYGSAPYSNQASLFDITSGRNGSCTPAYLCTSGSGYDGPTGLGTPNGAGAFGGPPNPGSRSGSTTTSSTTSTTLPKGTQFVANPGFETGSFSPWTAGGGAPDPVVTTAKAHGGSYSAFLGAAASPASAAGDSWIAQTITIPKTTFNVTLQFWYWAASQENSSADWQQVQVRDPSTGQLLVNVFKFRSNAQTWRLVSKGINSLRGKTVQLWFNVHQDADAQVTSMYVDDVTVKLG